jgi:hypothetical protein
LCPCWLPLQPSHLEPLKFAILVHETELQTCCQDLEVDEASRKWNIPKPQCTLKNLYTDFAKNCNLGTLFSHGTKQNLKDISITQNPNSRIYSTKIM